MPDKRLKNDYEYYEEGVKETPPDVNVGKSHNIQGSPIQTPQGRVVDTTNPLVSLMPDTFWQEREAQVEAERAAKEKRIKTQRTAKHLGDAIRVLGDVAGMASGAHNEKWQGTDYKPYFAALESVDAESASKLQRLKDLQRAEANRKAEIEAAQKAAKEEKEAARAQRDKENADEWDKLKFRESSAAQMQEQRLKHDAQEGAKDRYARTAAAASKQDDKKNIIKYSTKETDRKSPNYSRVGAQANGDVEIEPQHAAALIRDLVSQYEALKSGATDKDGFMKLRSFEKSAVFPALKKYVESGRNLQEMTSGDIQTLLDATYTPENYLKVINQPVETPQAPAQQPWINPYQQLSDYVKTQRQQQPVQQQAQPVTQQPVAPVSDEIPTITISDEEAARITPNRAAAKGAPEQVTRNFDAISKSKETVFNDPALSAPVNSPEWTRSARKLAQTPYERLAPEERQDKLAFSISDEVSGYAKKYPITNTSTMANSHREETAAKISEEVLRYLEVSDPGQIELLKIVSEREGKPIESYLMDVAHMLGRGEITINDLKN